MAYALALLLFWVIAGEALAHDRWANGDPVPAWVKESCCGKSDAHRLTPSQVHETTCGGRMCYKVDGFHGSVPYSQLLPSQDGNWWAFYMNEHDLCSPEGGCGSTKPVMYCLFGPMEF